MFFVGGIGSIMLQCMALFAAGYYGDLNAMIIAVSVANLALAVMLVYSGIVLEPRITGGRTRSLMVILWANVIVSLLFGIYEFTNDWPVRGLVRVLGTLSIAGFLTYSINDLARGYAFEVAADDE